MKKNIMLFAGRLSLVLALGMLFSCKKSNNIEQDDTIYKVKLLTEEYINSAKDKNIASKPKWLKILGADLGGALSGAGVGAGVGAAVGGVGAGPGAVIGGVVGGASASIKASYEHFPINDPDYDPDPNTNNPYDYIGHQHYHTINNALTNADNYSYTGDFSLSRFYNFSILKLISDSIISSTDTTLIHFSLSDCSDVVTQTQLYTDSTLESFVNSITNTYITSNTKLILTYYFDALENTVDISDFIEFSTTIEDIIATSNIFTPMEQQIILGTMSTGRYGIQYWGLK